MLGIIGGMGPMSSSLFYSMITEKTPAEGDQDHMDLIMLSHASMPDRTEAILSGDRLKIEKVRDLLASDIEKLLKAGADNIAIACNTAHYFVDLLGEEKKHVIHMVKETVRAVEERDSHVKTALLATDGTIKTRLYQSALEDRGMEVFLPSDTCQRKIMSAIYDCVKRGRPIPQNLWEDIHREITDSGCDHALLGCTELSIAAVELSLDISREGFYIDPLDILAERCVEIYKEKAK
ncbi:MAG TPA: aspartate/glutamate racemase family protein [Candidatus Copromorpha excrementigallinarum]|uniref:Aspartate/glutamate racemase family protein n=1 Tax=Candidatus Allocopromorpha excrementigallinarum TaxID=2840742 RepID=A0A9D1L666_9FIRM|nr:aspartate/glutamate racemase family protein [Candidatus Copromorpha excrementigallinarum]